MASKAGDLAGWLTLGGLALLASAQPFGCAGPAADAADPVVDALLADVGPEVVSPTLDRFVTGAGSLSTAVAAWRASPDDDAARLAARDAWMAAMAVWQQVELMQIGPTGASVSTIAGEDLRDEIYSWPTVGPCHVDQQLVEGGWDDAGFFGASLVTGYGLDALEHLLYAEGGGNACPSQVAINDDGTWDALGEAEVVARRADLATVLAAEVLHQGEALRDRWRDFGSELASAGGESSPYTSPDEALDEVFAALFYVETLTRDRKVGQPLGLAGCEEETCSDAPDEVESLPSGASVDWLVANLEGFERVFTGADGTGFDDLLADRGHADLTGEILDALSAATDAANALTVPVDEALTAERTELLALHAALTVLADLVKSDLATVLLLRIPDEAAGDND